MTSSEKISASLPAPDLTFLEEYMEKTGTTRSGALHAAVRALRSRWLENAYVEADEEWYEDDETAAAWDRAAGDGLRSAD